MPRKSKAILGIVLVAIAIVALSATYALGSPAYSVSLGISRLSGTYGTEFVITPTLEGTQTIVGDTYTLKALQPDGVTWANFGEGLKVDETGTVVPQFALVDETFLPWYTGFWHPTQFMCTFSTSRSKDASGVVIPYDSNTTPMFTVKRFGKVKWIPSVPKIATHNKKFFMSGQASPDAGIGNVSVNIIRKGTRTVNLLLQTDDSGWVSLSRKLASKGKYTVHMRWLGNKFGPASATTISYVTVR